MKFHRTIFHCRTMLKVKSCQSFSTLCQRWLLKKSSNDNNCEIWLLCFLEHKCPIRKLKFRQQSCSKLYRKLKHCHWEEERKRKAKWEERCKKKRRMLKKPEGWRNSMERVGICVSGHWEQENRWNRSTWNRTWGRMLIRLNIKHYTSFDWSYFKPDFQRRRENNYRKTSTGLSHQQQKYWCKLVN